MPRLAPAAKAHAQQLLPSRLSHGPGGTFTIIYHTATWGIRWGGRAHYRVYAVIPPLGKSPRVPFANKEGVNRLHEVA